MEANEIQARLAHNEEAVSNLGKRFSAHENFVHKRFEIFDSKLDDLESMNRQSESRILDKISSLTQDTANMGKVSWPLIVSVFVAMMGIVGWGMSQQQTSAVNEAVAKVHHDNQQKENNSKSEWNRRIVDRAYEDMKELYKTKIQLTEIRSELNYVQMMQNRRYQSILDNTKRTGEHEARLSQTEEELDKRWPQILDSTNKLGKLEPLIDEMGMGEVEGLKQKIDTLEKLIHDIDAKGSRVWNTPPNE